jgi:hypothetical protein
MRNYNRNLIVLMKTTTLSDEALEKHLECLDCVLKIVENDDAFCTSHELVARNSITTKRKKILKAVSTPELKLFYFLINKN